MRKNVKLDVSGPSGAQSLGPYFKLAAFWACLILSFKPFGRSSHVTHAPHPSGSQVVGNTVRRFGEIQLTIFEKYSKKRVDPHFLWLTKSSSSSRKRITNSDSWIWKHVVGMICFRYRKWIKTKHIIFGQKTENRLRTGMIKYSWVKNTFFIFDPAQWVCIELPNWKV